MDHTCLLYVFSYIAHYIDIAALSLFIVFIVHDRHCLFVILTLSEGYDLVEDEMSSNHVLKAMDFDTISK